MSKWFSKSPSWVLHFLLVNWKHQKFLSSYDQGNFLRASTWVTHNTGDVAADGRIVIWWEWKMVIIDQSKACMTGSSNDKCERRQQVDSVVSPLLSQRESPAQHPSMCSREWKTWKSFLSFTTVSFFFIIPLCVCVRLYVCALNTTVPFHQVLVPATHFIKGERKKKKQDFSYHCGGDTLCWQQTFFMQAAQKLGMQSTVQQEKSRQISPLWKQQG